MGYVMVPVPEEHVEEAMEAVLRITRQSRLTPWDQDTMNAFFSELDESAKALLSLVARATAWSEMSVPTSLNSNRDAGPSSSRHRIAML